MKFDTDEEAIAAVRAGGRAHVELSMFTREREVGPHGCTERIIVCDDPTDISECPICGKQKIVRCHFDDDYN